MCVYYLSITLVEASQETLLPLLIVLEVYKLHMTYLDILLKETVHHPALPRGAPPKGSTPFCWGVKILKNAQGVRPFLFS